MIQHLSGLLNFLTTQLSNLTNQNKLKTYIHIYKYINWFQFGDSIIELDQVVCWECLAIMKKFARFKRQVHNAQEHLRVLAISQSQEVFVNLL